MKKLNKIIAGLSLAATILAGASQFDQAPKEVAATDEPVQTYLIISDPGGGGGH